MLKFRENTGVSTESRNPIEAEDKEKLKDKKNCWL